MPVTKIFNNRPTRNGGSTIIYGDSFAQSNSGVISPRIINGYEGVREDDGLVFNAYNISITSADESLFNIPNGTIKLEMQCRTAVDVRFAFQSGKAFYSESPYFTIKANGAYNLDIPENGFVGETMYFAADSSVILELGAHQGRND